MIACDMLSSYYIDMREDILPIDFIMLDMIDFDVILDTDWLALHHACVDCHIKQVSFCLPDRDPIVLQGDSSDAPITLVFTLKAKKKKKRSE